MNRTKIEYCDYTWNPVTGCWGSGGTAENSNRCSYCYAKAITARFAGGEILEGNLQGHEALDPFSPRFHPDRLSQPAKVKKPSKIFVCSMADLFGDWVPTAWINQIIGTAWFVAPHHTYQFLTKNPKRLKEFNPWPSNCWVGTTVTNQADADERLPWLLQVKASVLFVSHEPLLGAINSTAIPYGRIEYTWGESHVAGHVNALTGLCCPIGSFQRTFQGPKKINWAIIGAMTGPGSQQHQPKPEWVQSLIDQYRAAEVPVFLKDNLHWPEKIQEWPE